MALKMRSALFIIVLFYANQVFSLEPVVPEGILASWGYETTELNEKWQSIKRIKGERWDENQVYYPRFTLSKSCYASTEAAVNEDKRIVEKNKNDPFGGFKSHYNGFISGKCLYTISTASRATFLDYQPKILEKFRTYILNEYKP